MSIRQLQATAKHDRTEKGKAVSKHITFSRLSCGDREVNRLKWLISVLSAHWLSLLLVAGLIAAVWFVYKHKDKFAKNEFE
ncbi:hypothetical protein FE783_14465 [Paenibacillus mesophilus]|uniref:hypothetical protein n=1 Tax=Paenibacillus mesophilus TaxID=2582849 RepID=UPI00110D62A9|nr:hypothetical protein [Paenibacillus mesophilus]TMV49692.1 hypothetical protein FE783_14465 [Paenibacillus mesophilus]